jgi:AraC-like DNA-binding protein
MDFFIILWYYLFRNMALDDLTFLHCNHDPICNARVNKHFDGYYTLQFGVTGGVELFYDGTRHVLDDGGAWFWSAFPGPRIRFHAAPGREAWEHRYVAFHGPRVSRWLAAGIWPHGPQLAPPHADYTPRFDTLLRLVRQSDSWSIARAVNLLEAFLLELAEDRAKRTAAPRTEPWLDAILERLSAAEAIAIEEAEEAADYTALASEWGMSISTLRRRFRTATGTPLHEWAMQARILRARALLGDTDLPVKAIAERLGYRDVYFFTRQFRQRVGVPPATYRRSRQG